MARLLAQSAHDFPTGQITEEAIRRIGLELKKLRRQAKEAKLLADFIEIMEQWAESCGKGVVPGCSTLYSSSDE